MVKESKHDKTTFTTPWATYVYITMPFGLTNARVTFQRAMDVTFSDIINVFLVVYQDYLIAYSKKESDHCGHLKKKIDRAVEYGISLNPKKCAFGVTESNLLGHIISKYGVRIDLERVVAIDKVP